MKLIFYQAGHHKNLSAIHRMCKSHSIELEVTENLDRIIKNDYDILICNKTFVDPEIISENIKIIYGPQLWVIPTGQIVGNLNNAHKMQNQI